jgi:hypothetical protein
MVKWEISKAVWKTPELAKLLEEGWEPFAVDTYFDIIWLKRRREE